MTTALLVNSGEFFASDVIENFDTYKLYSEERTAETFGHFCEYFDRHRAFLNDEASADQVGFFIFNRFLHLLGYTHSHNELLPDDLGRIEYTLFDSAEAFTAHLTVRGSSAFFNAAVGVAKVMPWAHELDDPMPIDPEDENSEVEPIAFLLDEMLRQTNLQWAILSNGKKWRLFHKNTVAMTSSFVEMDIFEIVENKDLEAFSIFLSIFGSKALTPDNTGTCPNRLHLS